MNLTAKNLKASFTAISVGLVLGTHAFAQVSTPIVGFQKKTVSPGLASVSFPLLNPDLAKTTVSAVVGNSLTLSGIANVGSLLSSGEPYYIEVYSGNLKGDRFDVNTSSTVSAANTTVVLDAASPNNTYPVSSIGASLDGATIALRKHVTLSQIQSFFSPALVGNNNTTLADQIQLFSPNGSFTIYSLRGNLTEWRISGDLTNYAKQPVPPGTGILINKKSASSEMTQTGTVRQNDFATPLVAGLQFVAPSVPLDRTPLSAGIIPNTNGWVGNNNSSLADQVMVFQNGTFTIYALRGDGQLRKAGDLTDYKATDLLSGGEAWLIKRKNADANLVENQIISN